MIKHRLTVEAHLILTESELRALDALAGYGEETFLEVFYKHLGKNYLKPHENGLRSLFKKVKKEVKIPLNQVDQARKLLKTKPSG